MEFCRTLIRAGFDLENWETIELDNLGRRRVFVASVIPVIEHGAVVTATPTTIGG